MVYTKYPTQIDTTTELPVYVNDVTPIDEVALNRLREAILALETELGVKPSGAQSTVKDRFTEIENLINNVIAPPAGSGNYIFTSIKTTTYTAAVGDLVRCDPSGGGFIVNLPTAVGNLNTGLVVKNVTSSTNTITITPNGGQTIDGDANFVISIGRQSITLASDGSNWVII